MFVRKRDYFKRSMLKAEKLKDKSTELDIESMKFKAESQNRMGDESKPCDFMF